MEERAIDITQLGKREKVVKIVDPQNPEIFSYVRLVKMTKYETEQCFKYSRQVYQKVKSDLIEQENTNHTFEKFVNTLSDEEVINILLTAEEAEYLANLDLVEIPDEITVVEELKEKGLSGEEIDNELNKLRQERVKEIIDKKREELKKQDIKELRQRVKDNLIEVQATQESNDAFIAMALSYMCYYKDKNERIFSVNPDDERFITKCLRDNTVYYQLVGAYKDFLQVLYAEPKDIRKQTQRGGNFFTHTK